MKAFIDAIALVADLIPGAAAVMLGIAVIVGGVTGVLWY